MMSPLARALRRGGIVAETWDGASVFGPLEKSIDGLQACLDRFRRQHGAVAMVSHSFGDWIGRQVLARGGPAGVSSLVSLAPVVAKSPAAYLATFLGGGVAPEVRTMADHARASSALHLPDGIDRLIVWARVDPWIGRPQRGDLDGIRQITVCGTHNSILFQRPVHRLVARFGGGQQSS